MSHKYFDFFKCEGGSLSFGLKYFMLRYDNHFMIITSEIIVDDNIIINMVYCLTIKTNEQLGFSAYYLMAY